ncbi:FAD-dependent oxidoreductase [Cohnella sp. WQ 127256]|uniref:FAD-dependent oxidoreductase n=1 Tax=Cohnella sp. WQ 127256 TaxID=2938790 RepID=UPI002118D373|nr:FAD-dependent oxidoreductase [Cohnella sp. WQ 127256]
MGGTERVTIGMRVVEESYDIVVCGGGLAGFSAAVAAARHGAQVCLVQDRPVFGGNSSSEIRVPPQGAASFHAYARETGIISELLIEERARNHESPIFDNGYINSVWDMVMYEMAMATPGLTFRLNSTVTDVVLSDERTVEAVIARVSHAETELHLSGITFIDCTGDGIVAALAGCKWRYGTEGRDEFGEPHAPEKASDAVMGSSIHIKAKNVGHPIPFTAPEWAVRYDDPDFFWKRGRGVNPYSGFWWMELSMPWHTIHDNETLRHELTRHVLGVWDYIKNRDPVLQEEAQNYALDWIGQVPGKRESRRIIGEYLMTEHDPLGKTVFPDEVAYGGWFIDLHEPGGLLAEYSEKTAVEEDNNQTYMAKSYVGPFGIPLRILIAKDMNNLMMAGRNVSVTHAALGTVRVMGTTAVMGQAAGTAAAIALKRGIQVREVPDSSSIHEVQQALLRDGCFLPNRGNGDPDDLARKATVRASSEATLAPVGPAPRGNLSNAQNDALTATRGQWIAVGADRLDSLAVCMNNDSGTVQFVEARVYAVDHLWDYRLHPDEPLAATLLTIPVGVEQWVEWRINLSVVAIRGSYVRLDLLANPHVSWVSASSIEPGHVSAYEIGEEKMRKLGHGVMMSLKVQPPQACYEAGNVLSGVTRPYRYTNLWRSDPSQNLPQWLELSWEEQVEVGVIELTFPGHLIRGYMQYPALYKDPQCPKDITLEAIADGQWVELATLRGNYQRRRVITLETAIITNRLRVVIHATNGDPSAAIYEIRCYPLPKPKRSGKDEE